MRTALRHRLHEHFVAWALRLSGTRPPEPVPVVLSRQRIYVLPTRGGLLYALALLVLLIGAINYNLSLGYGLVFLLGGLGVVTILHTFRNLAGTVLRVGIPLPVHAGDIARFPLLLDNAGRRMRHQIGLSLPGQPATWADVPTQDSTRYLLPLSAIRRGWLAMPRVTIETSWPLGLVRAWAYAAPAQTCLVYPRPATAAPPPPDFPGLRGDAGTAAPATRISPGCAATSPAIRPITSPGKPPPASGRSPPCKPSSFPARQPRRGGWTGRRCRPGWMSSPGCRS